MNNPVNPRFLAVKILDRVFRSQSYADILLEKAFSRQLISRVNRNLITELVYGTLRWLKYLDWIIDRFYHGRINRMPLIVRRILEVGIYQLLFMDKIPNHAAVDESVKITKQVKRPEWGSTVNAILRAIIKNRELTIPPAVNHDVVRNLSIKWSHPEWLIKKWIDGIGYERTQAICEVNNRRPYTSLRINQLRTNRERMQHMLSQHGITSEPSDFLDEFLVVWKCGNLITLELFKNGLFTIQDIGAGLVGHLMDPKPNERIVDVASAPGGKATHMAELAGDLAFIISVDRNRIRLLKIIENQERLRLDRIFPLCCDSCILCFENDSVDKVLVDVPCSGIGVIRKRGDLKWQRKESDIPELVTLQKELLEESSRIVRPGGVLVYSTCTTIDEENDYVIEDFLGRHGEFEVENASQFVCESLVDKKGYIRTWPDLHGIDGSFAVRLKKVK